MKKVKQIWYAKHGSPELTSNYATGLILELEDGTMLEQLSTDMIEPYAEIKDKQIAFGTIIPRADTPGSDLRLDDPDTRINV